MDSETAPTATPSEITQKEPDTWALGPREPIHLLAEALEEAQFSSGRMLKASQSKQYGELQIAAQDAVSGWVAARAALQRLEARVREDPQQEKMLEECRNWRQLVETAWSIVNDRLAQALVAVDDQAVVATLRCFQTSLTLASDALKGLPLRESPSPPKKGRRVTDVESR